MGNEITANFYVTSDVSAELPLRKTKNNNHYKIGTYV